jgi:hypothetical protein
MYRPLTTGITHIGKQCQDMDVVRFLIGLKTEYELVCSQILCISDLPYLHKV